VEKRMMLSVISSLRMLLDMAEAVVNPIEGESDPVPPPPRRQPTPEPEEPVAEPNPNPNPDCPILSTWIRQQKRKLRRNHPNWARAVDVSEELFGVYRRNVGGWGHLGAFFLFAILVKMIVACIYPVLFLAMFLILKPLLIIITLIMSILADATQSPLHVLAASAVGIFSVAAVMAVIEQLHRLHMKPGRQSRVQDRLDPMPMPQPPNVTDPVFVATPEEHVVLGPNDALLTLDDHTYINQNHGENVVHYPYCACKKKQKAQPAASPILPTTTTTTALPSTALKTASHTVDNGPIADNSEAVRKDVARCEATIREVTTATKDLVQKVVTATKTPVITMSASIAQPLGSESLPLGDMPALMSEDEVAKLRYQNEVLRRQLADLRLAGERQQRVERRGTYVGDNLTLY
jgi:hypothetical protein